MKWIIVILAALNFGYMSFDGSRALIAGHYITPSSGNYQGQLGPWSRVVSAVGIEPEGTLMKQVFVLWGLAGMAITALFLSEPEKYRTIMLVANICSLWYALAGTVSSLIQIILLWRMRV
ncbi:MAG: hypothetical protein KF744_04470 [Taibaiella sp.]|nr:hypothetical protein [Taibaiella sp.]